MHDRAECPGLIPFPIQMTVVVENFCVSVSQRHNFYLCWFYVRSFVDTFGSYVSTQPLHSSMDANHERVALQHALI